MPTYGLARSCCSVSQELQTELSREAVISAHHSVKAESSPLSAELAYRTYLRDVDAYSPCSTLLALAQFIHMGAKLTGMYPSGRTTSGLRYILKLKMLPLGHCPTVFLAIIRYGIRRIVFYCVEVYYSAGV